MVFGRKKNDEDSSSDDDSDDREKFVIGGSSSEEDDDDDSDDDDNDNANFKDETDENGNSPNEWQSINVNDEERGGAYNEDANIPRSTTYSGSEEENKKRRMMIIGLAVCCCIWLIASIVFGVLAFTKKDEAVPAAVAAQTRAPAPTTAPVAAPTNAPNEAPSTEPPSIGPSESPSGFLQNEFVYPVLASTFIQDGVTNPQINSPILLVENGNGVDNTDASSLIEVDVSSKIDNIFRQRRELKGQFTGKATKSFLRLFLAADPGSPPPKLTLFLLPDDVDLKFLTAQEFNPVLAEELQSFRFGDLPHPALTGIANMDKNVFLPPPSTGDPIWIDITEAVDNAAAFGQESIILMLQNRDAVQAPGGGTKLYGVNSADPPALVVFLDDRVPTISPVPSMSMAPSMNPSGSIYPTGSDTPTTADSTQPSPGPSTSYRPTNKPSKLGSSTPTIAPSGSARPSASERPSTVPSLSSAPSASAQPSKVASGAPSRAPLASEFPTTSNQCLPCPEGQVLKFETLMVASLSETCADLRLRLLFSDYAVYDATPTQCDDIVNTCGCEAPVACTTCTGFEKFRSSDTISVNGVSCQEAEVTLATQEFAYGSAQCAALKDACSCGAPTTNCLVCPSGQVVGDPDYVISTATLGLISCGDLEVSGSYGYVDEATCSKLESAGVADLCDCEQASSNPSTLNISTMSMAPSIPPSSQPSKLPSASSAPSSSVAPSKQPSASNSPSKSAVPSKQPTTSAAPSTTPQKSAE